MMIVLCTWYSRVLDPSTNYVGVYSTDKNTGNTFALILAKGSELQDWGERSEVESHTYVPYIHMYKTQAALK